MYRKRFVSFLSLSSDPDNPNFTSHCNLDAPNYPPCVLRTQHGAASRIHSRQGPSPVRKHTRTSVLLEWKSRSTLDTMEPMVRFIPRSRNHQSGHKPKEYPTRPGPGCSTSRCQGSPISRQDNRSTSQTPKTQGGRAEKVSEGSQECPRGPGQRLTAGRSTREGRQSLIHEPRRRRTPPTSPNRPGIQITDLDLRALMHECEAIFVKPSNVTIERVNIFRRVP